MTTMSDLPSTAGTRCPHLGLENDASAFYPDPSPLQRCFIQPQPTPIAEEHQAAYCLSETHTACHLFALGGGSGVWAEGEDEEESPADEEQESSGQVGNGALLASVVLAAAVFLFVGSALSWASSSRGYSTAYVASGVNEPPGGESAAAATLTPAVVVAGSAAPQVPTSVKPAATSPSQTETAAPTNATRVVATATSVASSPTAPSSARGVTPSPAPSRPTPSSTDAQTFHVVQPGEGLWSIAKRYGLTTEELAKANGIADVNSVWAGQRLTIPQSQSPR